MSAISCDQIVASLPRVTCACGEPVRFNLYRDEQHRTYRLGVRHGSQDMGCSIPEGAYYGYGRGEFEAMVIRTFRQMAERAMQECPRAAWHSTGEIEFRDGRREMFRALTNSLVRKVTPSASGEPRPLSASIAPRSLLL